MNRLAFILILSFIVIISACTAQTTNEAVPTTEAATVILGENPIVIGDMGDNPDTLIRLWQPFVDYLATNLADYGIDSGAVRIAASVEEMADLLQSGEVDIFIDSSYPSILVSELSGSDLVLRHWRYSVPEYYSVFFTLADSPIESVADLRGNIVAFDKSSSTSGFFLPSLFLMRAGYTLREVSSTDATIADDEIAYIFSQEDVNTIQWVVSGRVLIGVVDDVTYSGIPEETRNGLSIIAETENLPRQMVSLSPTVDDTLQDAIIDLLVSMDETPEAKAILDHIQTTQFDEFPDGVDAFRDRINEMLLELRGTS